MSAYIVNEYHINVLLTWANLHMDKIYIDSKNQFDTSDIDDLQRMAEILQDENVRSVDHRYKEVNMLPIIKFEFERGRAIYMQPVEILKACYCYNYQACETDNFYESVAYKIIRWIINRAVAKLPGYDKAEWELNKKEDEPKVISLFG